MSSSVGSRHPRKECMLENRLLEIIQSETQREKKEGKRYRASNNCMVIARGQQTQLKSQ